MMDMVPITIECILTFKYPGSDNLSKSYPGRINKKNISSAKIIDFNLLCS